MRSVQSRQSSMIARNQLNPDFPTQLHEAAFWEALGRAVGTFGFLENTLAKAIFSFTATREYADNEIDEAFEKWIPKLQKVLRDPLGALIEDYKRAVEEHADAPISNFDELVADLRSAKVYRNVLCHGFWGEPDDQGRSVPFFINSKDEKFETALDASMLQRIRAYVAGLALSVVDTVTVMGWQFPGTAGPGEVIVRSQA